MHAARNFPNYIVLISLISKQNHLSCFVEVVVTCIIVNKQFSVNLVVDLNGLKSLTKLYF